MCVFHAQITAVFLPAPDALGHAWTRTPHRQLRMLPATPGPEQHIASSGCCGPHLYICQIECRIECQIECQNSMSERGSPEVKVILNMSTLSFTSRQWLSFQCFYSFWWSFTSTQSIWECHVYVFKCGGFKPLILGKT